MTSNEKALLQALQDIAAACSAASIDDVERTHEGFSSSDAHAYTVGKVQAIAENAIRVVFEMFVTVPGTLDRRVDSVYLVLR